MEEISFKQIFDNVSLYREDGKKAMLAVLSGPSPGDSMTMSEALQNKSASFIYCTRDITSSAEAVQLIEDCKSMLEASKASRGILWLGDRHRLVCAVSDDFTMIAETFRTTISGTRENGIDIRLGSGMELHYSSGMLEFSDLLYFSFGDIRMDMKLQRISINLCGDLAGTLNVFMHIPGYAFNSVFSCGFEYGFSQPDNHRCLVSSRLFSSQSIAQQNLHLHFSFGFDIYSANRIYFLESDVSILSNFITIFGERIYLSPVIDGSSSAGMTFLPRISEHVNCTPYGKYQVTAEPCPSEQSAAQPFATEQTAAQPSAAQQTAAQSFAVHQTAAQSSASPLEIKLLCGFSGTEYICMENHGILEFSDKQSAFSAFYPQKGISIDSFANCQPEHMLSDELITAGVSFYGKYYSQPLQAPFFTGSSGLLSLADLYADFSNGSPPLPLIPYMDVKIHQPGTKDAWADQTQISEYEKQILMAERGICTSNACKNGKAKYQAASALRAAAPSGFIGEIAQQQFQKMYLAFSPGGNLSFSDITDVLRAAFLDASMFCVIADTSQAGTLNGKFSIDGWEFTLTPGTGSKLNDYANILILKGSKGKLYDPGSDTAGLCRNIGLWTGKDSFSVPKQGQTANLANWMQNYCKNAYDNYMQGDQELAHFARILTDEEWKGILILNASVNPSSFPDCLKPLLAGSDISSIHAHHIGAELVPVRAAEGGPQPEGNSPFFGLIHYLAEGFTSKALPVTDPNAVYEFRLLELKAVFEKGALKDFHSVSQLVLGELMALKPSSGGCLYNALLLNGSIQDSDGHSALVMNTEGGFFCFQNAPVSDVNITGITMETINAKKMDYAFRLSGSITFQASSEDTNKYRITQNAPAMDLSSYDSLVFSNYCLHLTDHQFCTDTDKMEFDLSHSVLREQSVCRYFGMTAASMRTGDTITDGFAAVAAQNCKISPKLDGQSAGIIFSVKLGSLGGLSAGASLTAELLLAWDSKNHLYLGIKLPGSSIIDGVLGVTFGNVQLLLRDRKPVLYLPKTALQLFGLLSLPPNGALTLAMEGSGEGIGWFGAYQPKQ